MPTLALDATNWEYRVDLSQGPGQFSTKFVETFVDSGFTPSEDVLNDALASDRVELYVYVNSSYQFLGEFIVDEYSVGEEADGVTATLQGRDAKALLLEKFP